MIVVQLVGHVAPDTAAAGPDVARQRPRPLDLGQGPGRLAPPELELEEPVAGGVVPLGEEQVVLVPGVDMGDPPPVAQDLHRLRQPGDRQDLGLPEAGETSIKARQAIGNANATRSRRHEWDRPG